MSINKSLWNKDKLSKITNLKEYLEEIFKIKDGVISLKEEEREKEKTYLAAKNRRRFQEDKLERAYEGLERFRK